MRALLWRIHFDTGIAAEWGGGRDRWIARLSCGENRFVLPSEEEAFLSDAGLIRLGISSDLCERLERYGILTVGQFLQVPRSFLLAHLGLSAQEILPFLQRDASVRALYPPPSVTEQAAVGGAGEEAILCAIEKVAQKGAAALAESGHACGSIRITLFVRGGAATGDLRLAKGVCGEAEIERIVLEFLRQHGTRDVVSIQLQLGDLLPRGKEQITLWQSTTHRPERTQRIENARRDLSRKFGPHAVFSGGEYSRTIPPRFAQLICARRGMYLP